MATLSTMFPRDKSGCMSYGIDLELLKVDNTKNSQTDAIVTGKIVKGVARAFAKAGRDAGLSDGQQER